MNLLHLYSIRAKPIEALPPSFVLRYRSLSLNQAAFPLTSAGAALSPRRATYFSLLRQRNLRKRKATLVPASLRCASGNLWCSLQAGSRTNSPSAQTSARPDPLEAPLLGASTRVWRMGAGAGADSDSDSGLVSSCNATIFIAAFERFAWARSLNGSRNRRAAWFLRSDRNFAAQRSAAPEGRAVGAGDLGSDFKNARIRIFSTPPFVCAEKRRSRRIRARACLSAASLHETPAGPSTAGCPQRNEGTQTAGSPFLGLLSFGEAKESESPAAATERQDLAKNLMFISEKGFDTSARTACGIQGFRPPPQEVEK